MIIFHIFVVINNMSMKKGTVTTIGIEDFKANSHIIDYVDDDFVVINSLENLPNSNDTVRLNCFLVIFCIEGCVQLEMNTKTYLLEANHMMICLPTAVLSHALISPKHKISIMGFSTRFLQRTVKMDKETWNTISYVYNNPVKYVEESDNLIFKLYTDLIIEKINQEPQLYYGKEIMQYLFSALFCEMIADLKMNVDHPAEAKKIKDGMKQADYIFKRFMEKLSMDNGSHRSVQYYANELFYTPKYLSKVIKQVCGRGPLDLINEHTIELIKYQLKHSEKSIKEIAEEFNFSNISFLGKYVKAHLGMSPSNYRNSEEN